MEQTYRKWDQVLTIVNGKDQKAVVDSNGAYPIYGSGGVIGRANDYLCEAGTTIVGRKGTINSPIFVNERFWNVDTAFGIIPGNELLPKYLFYFCCHFNFKSLDKSTTIPSLAKRDLLSIEMPVPPLEEQARIVARIEELFSELDAGAETLQKIKQQLSVYRQSALSNALKSIPNMRIEDCIESMGQGWSPKCDRVSTVDNSEWAVITTTAVQPMKFDFRENKKLPDVLQPREKHELKVGDILVTRAGPRSRCGICCMVRKTKKRLMNCDKVYRIRVKRGLILPEYLEAILNSPDVVREIAFCKTGGNDSGVNLTQDRFLSIWIPVPAIQEQRDALDEIASRMSVCDSIEKTVDEALQQSAAMRQSILKQAFEGGL